MKRIHFGRLPPDLSFWHPAALTATWGGSGLLPGAPGTWGSLATLPFAWLIASYWGTAGLLIASAAAFVGGMLATARYLKASTSKDPGAIVIDETAGQFLALALVPLDPWWYAAGFVLFRAFDILKPWPASWADRSLPGAWGVMLDDLLAGAYALLILFVAGRLLAG